MGFLDSWADQVKEIMPFLLLFITSSIAGAAFIVSKLMFERPALEGWPLKAMATVELILLLMAAGNAMGSYTLVRLLFQQIETRRRDLLFSDDPVDLAAFKQTFEASIGQVGAAQLKLYQQAYWTLAVALVLGAITAIVLIWTAHR